MIRRTSLFPLFFDCDMLGRAFESTSSSTAYHHIHCRSLAERAYWYFYHIRPHTQVLLPFPLLPTPVQTSVKVHYIASSGPTWGEHEIDYVFLIQADVDLNPNPNEVRRRSLYGMCKWGYEGKGGRGEVEMYEINRIVQYCTPPICHTLDDNHVHIRPGSACRFLLASLFRLA